MRRILEKNKTHLLRFLVIIIISFILLFIPKNSFAGTKIPEDTLRFYSKNNILYYNPLGSIDCYTPSSVGMTEGNNVKEVVWNYFAEKGFSSEVIAGIMGNIETESGFDPFEYGHSGSHDYYGLFMMEDTTDFVGHRLRSFLWQKLSWKMTRLD